MPTRHAGAAARRWRAPMTGTAGQRPSRDEHRVVARDGLELGERGEIRVGQSRPDNRKHELLPGPQPVGERHRQRHGIDLNACASQLACEPVQAVADVAGHRQQVAAFGEDGRHRTAVTAPISGPGSRWSRHAAASSGTRAGHDAESSAEIVETARQRAAAVDVGFDQVSRRSGDVAPAGHYAPGGLQPVDTIKVRRVADRAADVAAQLQRREPGGDRGGRAARGSPGVRARPTGCG